MFKNRFHKYYKVKQFIFFAPQASVIQRDHMDRYMSVPCPVGEDNLLKYLNLAAAAVSLIVPASLWAGGHEGPSQGAEAPRRGPPPEVVSQANLARLGLLPLMYSEREYGLLQTRTGESRSRIGNAGGPGGPAGDYKHNGAAIVAPLFLRYGLPDTTAYVMGRLTFGTKIEADNITQSDSTNGLAWVGYQNFYDKGAMWSVQLGGLALKSEGEGARVQRNAINLRFDHIRQLSDNWGFVGRAYFSTGENKVLIKGPGISYTQPEDQVYVQAELAGNFTSEDLSFVPESWAFRPVIGTNFQRYFLTEVTNSAGGTEDGGQFDVGNVWAKATLAKMTPPGKWAPNVTLGLEHTYQDAYSDFIDDRTHLIAGVGASMLIPGGGNTIAIGLDHRQGLNGKRSNTQLTTVFNFTF